MRRGFGMRGVGIEKFLLRIAWRAVLAEKSFLGRARLFGKFLGVVIGQWRNLIRGSARSVTRS